MAKQAGWWSLDTEDIELNDVDREHIAQCIIDGCTNGEICQDTSEEDEEEDEC
jgi:hypothetical protein